MIGRSLSAGGLLIAVAGLVLTAAGRAEEPGNSTPSQPTPSMILNLIDQAGPAESPDKAFTESIKRDAAAPRSSSIDDWEPQQDGSMRNKRSGIRLVVRNPCPPGDIEHEFALAAYNRAMAGKARR